MAGGERGPGVGGISVDTLHGLVTLGGVGVEEGEPRGAQDFCLRQCIADSAHPCRPTL
jgi:hypothetical protein